MKKLLLIFAMALIFSLAFIQAPEGINEEPVEVADIAIPAEPLEDKAGWTIDNKYDFNSSIDLGKAEIKSTIFWVIPSDPIEDITLKQNTFTCEGSVSNPCLAEKEITIYKDTKLVDEAVFDGRIKSYKFQIRTSHKLVTRKEIVHECSSNTECTDKEVEINYYDDKWIDYNYEVMPKGTYTLRLVGYKVKASDDVEWYVVSQGRTILEWANWGASTLTTDLRNYYNFDEGSGTTVLDSLSTHNGTKQGNFAWNSTAKLGTYAGKFPDDGNSYVNIGNISSNGIAQFTISAWINPASLGEYQNVLSRTSTPEAFKTMIRDSNVLQMCTGGTCIWGTNTLNQGVWYHAVYVYNGVNQTIFLNGVWEQSGAKSGAVPATAGDALIGRDQTDTASDFDGLIDEVGFWNRSLTYSEIQLLYNSATGRTYPFPGSSITLNSPLDNYASSNPLVNFSANITHSAQLVNASLWTNATGTWARNQTISLTGTINQSVFNVSFAEGTYKWGVQACDTDGDCGFSSTNRTFSIDNTPPSINIIYPTGTINGLSNGQNVSLNYSITGTPQACGYQYNGANTTIGNCNANASFTYVSGVNSIIVWANDSSGNYGSDTESWTPTVTFNSITYNSSTYETDLEGFVANITGATNVDLVYSGTAYTATVSGQIVSRSISVPSSSGNKSFYWKINNGIYNSTTYYQYVNPILLSLCNSTNNVPYLNITFADELTSNPINGTLSPLTITYYSSDISAYKTYTLTNTTTTNTNYPICFTPSSKTITASISATSSMTDYATRNWIANYNLTNSTTTKIVYLLANVDGIYQNVIVSNSAGTTLQNALVTASTGSLGVVASGTTDSGGAVSLWLDPNKAHTLTTSLAGYPTDSRVINPSSTTTVYVTLGGTSTYPANLTLPSTEGITYAIEPTNTSLYNNTIYNFKFTVTPNTLTITNFRFDLYNSSNSILVSDTSNSNGGTLTQSYNVGSNSKITMKAYYTVNGTTTSLSRTWNILNSDDTQYSIFFLKNRIITYLDSGFFGLTRGFGMNLFCFIIIFITVGVFSWKYGINSDILIAAMTLFLVWLFEYGLGLIYVSSSVPMTFWVALVTIGLLIKEGLKQV